MSGEEESSQGIKRASEAIGADIHSNSGQAKRLKRERRRGAPVWQEGVQPVQMLNELLPGLEYEGSEEAAAGERRARFLCRVQVRLEREEADSPLVEVLGDGLNKREARAKCAFLALCHLYPDTFRPPQQALSAYERSYSAVPARPETADPLGELKKRVGKLCSRSALLAKTASQLLHEVSAEVAGTGTCVQTDGRFKFEYRNTLVGDEAGTQLAHGFGKWPFVRDLSLIYNLDVVVLGRSKKEAKQLAAKQALKLFLDCDVDAILAAGGSQ